MNKYRVVFEKKVFRDVKGIPKDILKRLRETTCALEDDPRPHGCVKLTDKDGFRIRVGDYRILYLVDDENQVVVVTRIKHRREVYR